MFKNRDLKQLRKVQLAIRLHKADMEKLNSPKMDSFGSKIKLYDVLRPLFYGRSLSPDEFLELNDESLEYLQQIGRYLMNIADYVDTKKVYDKELKRLLKEERRLKEKLGIE